MTTRHYSSPARAEATRANRQRILDAARQLFLKRGYVGTTVEAVAGRAGVSVQTIYNTVGGKAAVLKAVYDVMIAGDADPVPVVERATGRAMLAADRRADVPGPVRADEPGDLRADRAARADLLTEGAAGDREVRAFIDTIENERAVGTRGIAAHVASRFGLRDGLGVDEAADILWTLTSPDVVYRLVRRRRWSLERVERWLGETLADALLPR